MIEVIAAMLFLAILLPVLQSAFLSSNRVSVLSERSAIAGELGQNKLNELLLNDTWQTAGNTKGDFGQDRPGYRWELKQATWEVDTTSGMIELTLDVYFTVQGKEHSVRLGTLVNPSTSSSSSSTGTSQTQGQGQL